MGGEGGTGTAIKGKVMALTGIMDPGDGESIEKTNLAGLTDLEEFQPERSKAGTI